ncbi:hypothetical protein PR003_g30030 [Phytophthora rubi]|uniref:RxLR effector protein n=1 Tax=Phytophthora rubi TaxID=129364 RepID=A0A6A4BMD7_9STRA|nr:hypothetical protein PR003_g30030 [Phytophthora rubi]
MIAIVSLILNTVLYSSSMTTTSAACTHWKVCVAYWFLLVPGVKHCRKSSASGSTNRT